MQILNFFSTSIYYWKMACIYDWLLVHPLSHKLILYNFFVGRLCSKFAPSRNLASAWYSLWVFEKEIISQSRSMISLAGGWKDVVSNEHCVLIPASYFIQLLPVSAFHPFYFRILRNTKWEELQLIFSLGFYMKMIHNSIEKPSTTCYNGENRFNKLILMKQESDFVTYYVI